MEAQKDSPVLTYEDKNDPQIKADEEYGWSLYYFMMLGMHKGLFAADVDNSRPPMVCELANGIFFDEWYGKKVSQLKIVEDIIKSGRIQKDDLTIVVVDGN